MQSIPPTNNSDLQNFLEPSPLPPSQERNDQPAKERKQVSKELGGLFDSLGVKPLSAEEQAALDEIGAAQDAKPKSTPEQLEKLSKAFSSIFEEGGAPKETKEEPTNYKPYQAPVAAKKPQADIPKPPVAPAPPPLPEFIFSQQEKNEVAIELTKAKSTWLKKFKLNSSMSVSLRLINERDLININKLAQEARVYGDRRRAKEVWEGIDEQKNPYRHERDLETVINIDTQRADRFAEVLVYTGAINETLLPTDLDEKEKVLMEYSPFILDLIFTKVVRMRALVTEVLNNFESF